MEKKTNVINFCDAAQRRMNATNHASVVFNYCVNKDFQATRKAYASAKSYNEILNKKV